MQPEENRDLYGLRMQFLHFKNILLYQLFLKSEFSAHLLSKVHHPIKDILPVMPLYAAD